MREEENINKWLQNGMQSSSRSNDDLLFTGRIKKLKENHGVSMPLRNPYSLHD